MHAEILGEALLECIVEAAGGEPAVERGLHHVLQLRGADHLARGGHRRLACDERPRRGSLLRVSFDQLQNLAPKLVYLHVKSLAPRAGLRTRAILACTALSASMSAP